MKRLFLLRHAQAASAKGHADHERILTERGQAQAVTLGKTMSQKGYQPELVYCSFATRTRQTYDGLSVSLEPGKVEYSEQIYYASRGELLDIIQKTSDEVSSILLVAHNPSIYELAVMLSSDQARLSMGYNPATLSVLDCACENWADIQPGENTLVDVIES